MKMQAMSKGLRLTITAREARNMRTLLERGAEAMGVFAPDDVSDMLAMLDIGIHEVTTKQAEARGRKKDNGSLKANRPHRNIEVEGFTISATLGDYIDVSPDPDRYVWVSASDERIATQGEVRRNVWQVCVLDPDPYGRMFLAFDCTMSACEAEIEPVARRLVAGLEKVPA